MTIGLAGSNLDIKLEPANPTFKKSLFDNLPLYYTISFSFKLSIAFYRSFIFIPR